MSYRAESYDGLNPKQKQLYDYLVRYHAEHGGRRASRHEMREANGLSREPLNRMLRELKTHGLFETELDAAGRARSYTLPGEEWTHPHLRVMQLRKTFYTAPLLEY